MQDLLNTLKSALAIEPAAYTATKNGAIIDMQGHEAVLFTVLAGAITTADGTNYFEFSLQHGDLSDLSDAAAVSGSDLIGANFRINHATDFDNKYVGELGYKGGKRYVRLIATETGLADGTFCATAHLGLSRSRPV